MKLKVVETSVGAFRVLVPSAQEKALLEERIMDFYEELKTPSGRRKRGWRKELAQRSSALAVIASVVDENGNRMFSMHDLSAVERLPSEIRIAIASALAGE